jgi:hypothetical protein
MRATLLLASALTVGLPFLPGLTACTPCGIGPTEAEEYTEGSVSPSGQIYQTTLVGEEFLPFPSGHTYDLVHGLGVAPASYQAYLSFVPRLTEDGDPFDPFNPNNLSTAAGNQLVVERWDDEVIRIRNDTCADFYVRLVAFADLSGGIGAAGAPAMP